jgi:hypothetical protein
VCDSCRSVGRTTHSRRYPSSYKWSTRQLSTPYRARTCTVGQELEPQNDGPIIAVGKFGGTEASTFAVLTSLFQQINYESHADVFVYAI